MNEQVKLYMEKYPSQITDMFDELRKLIYESVSSEPQEGLWARLPSYFIGDRFVRLIPFKDHINIEARAVNEHKNELTDYKITPKGMLQIYTNQEIPTDILKRIFSETLEK